MRLKTHHDAQPRHSDIVSCVGWTGNNELFSCGDDQRMQRWNGDGDYIGQASCAIFDGSNPKSSIAGNLNAPPVFITDIHWFPMAPGKGQNTVSEMYAAAGTDGKLYLCSKAGRIEKVVEGHKGAVLAVKWNYDGTALVTAGEDGHLKIWSRTGMLRSGLVSTGYPIYSVAWSPDNDSLLYTNGRNLVIKPIQPASKPLLWKAHDGVILKVDWNMATNLIVSGSEDCRYKVWDAYGRQVYSSTPHDHPITSLAWSPAGDMFAVGLFNTLRVCDKLGWSYAVEKPECGSIFNIAWTPDGTQVACAGGNGAVVFGHVIDRRLEWKNYEVTLIDDRKIKVHEVIHGAIESLEFRDRVVKVSLCFGHLIVATYAQCYIYSDKNWNTPVIIDMSNNGRVICIKQCPDFFLIVDNATGIQVFSYEGRLICSPKYPGLRPEFITSPSITLSNDTLAIKDRADEKLIYIFEVSTGRLIGDGSPFKLQTEAIEIALNQIIGPGGCRQLAIVDKNREMFLTPVLKPEIKKIGTMVDTFSWNDEADMIAAIVDWKFMVWYYPNVVFIDSDIESMTRFERDGSSVFGKNAQFTGFNGTQCNLRRADGALVSATNISPLPALLQEIVKKKQWEEAIRLCRFAKMKELWACLAAMSVSGQDLNTAELSYAAIEQAQKVQYICYIRDIPSQEGRAAELALIRKQAREAEAILLSAGLIYRAIMLNINLFRWERALELAVKHKTHVDTALYFREKYLRQINRKEFIKGYIQYTQGVTLDWDKIKAKMETEDSNEKSRGRVKGQGGFSGPSGGSNENLKASTGGHERNRSTDSRKSRDD
ncbi:WD40-repeat-containing domain protein [Chytriomyces sp. MP71]|nr:WD40-repeat-containing domain protein [Chytriomyces sp. MP71]